ncbi:unnamed protein product [Vicia faba]|uniref:Uncharacterized protein n=1 Tax=Vicia faba TaxID=3906 RepID=A0AAV0ZM25_VICFA|nr:unnamed protein product [Vicia faba]
MQNNRNTLIKLPEYFCFSFLTFCIARFQQYVFLPSNHFILTLNRFFAIFTFFSGPFLLPFLTFSLLSVLLTNLLLVLFLVAFDLLRTLLSTIIADFFLIPLIFSVPFLESTLTSTSSTLTPFITKFMLFKVGTSKLRVFKPSANLTNFLSNALPFLPLLANFFYRTFFNLINKSLNYIHGGFPIEIKLLSSLEHDACYHK